MVEVDFPKELVGVIEDSRSLIAPALIEVLDQLGYRVEIRLMRKPEEKKHEPLKDSAARWHKQYLYKMTFPNGKVYIGTAFDINKRWANNGAGYRGQKVWEPIQRYGWDNIKREILMYIPYSDDASSWSNSDKIREEERRLIAENEGNCYNLVGTTEFHDEVARKVREAGRKNYGKYLHFDGREKTYVQWSREPGVTVSAATIRSRIEERGWDVEKALFTPSLANVGGTPEERRAIWESYNNQDRRAEKSAQEVG